MHRFLEWLRHRSKLAGLPTQQDLSDASGISLRTISKIFSDETIAKTERSIKVWLARTLKVSVRDLENLDSGKVKWIDDSRVVEWEQPYGLGSTGPGKVSATDGRHRGVPVLGKVTAGGAVESYEFDPDEVYRLPIEMADCPSAFALEIAGDSMTPLYQPGECVILRPVPREEMRDGEDAMIQLDGGEEGKSCFKRLILLGDGKIRLLSLNPKYPPKEILFTNVARVGRVIGKYTPVTILNGEPK